MRVRRDFDRVYENEDDPWAIGDADDPRYDLYRDHLLAHVHGGSILDIGCGLGAFLGRFAGEFDELVGVETAGEAVRRGRELRPGIRFVHAHAERLDETDLQSRSFDAILLSDVLYYLPRRGRTAALDWTASHLRPNGRALVAAWCPGGRYFEPDELRALVRASLRIVDDVELPSQHVALVARPKLRLAAFTDAAPEGAVLVADADRALASLPQEPSPEVLRWRRRFRLASPAATADELVAIACEETPALRAALEQHGFRIVSVAELARAGR